MKQVEVNKNIKLSEHLVSPSEAALSHLSELNGLRLSPHFKLGELCKTSHQTADGNIPSRVAIENLRNICENWLEDLRYSYNTLYKDESQGVVINSGYRSMEVNRLSGGSPTSNHLTGCAVDIRVTGFEQAIRYASILLDISDGTKRDFDELYIERNKAGSYWIHFAVRPSGRSATQRDACLSKNRRKSDFIQT